MDINVLVVDDEERNLEVMSVILEDYDELNVYEASDGKEALEIIESVRIDLAFVDLMMPEMDGKELIEKIRKELKIKDMFIVVVSALGDHMTKKEVFRLGAEDYVEKPIDLDAFADKLEKLIIKIKHPKECYHYARYSLFFGKYEPVVVSFTIKCERDITYFTEMMEFFNINPIELIKVVNAIKRLKARGTVVKFAVEKNEDYIYLTSRDKIFEDEKNSRRLCALNSSELYTYRLKIGDNKTKMENKTKEQEEQKPRVQPSEIEDDFLEFDDDEVEYGFMHNYKKIDAKTYIKEAEITQEEIDDVKDLSEELEFMLYSSSKLTEELRYDLIKIFTAYSHLFVSFIEINTAMNELKSILSDIDLNSIPDEMNSVILDFLKALRDDLSGWLENVFIEQSAVDIHYLDASILSSILQIKTMLIKYVDNI